jgi:hypothetical protein
VQHRDPGQRQDAGRVAPKRLGADRNLALELDVCAAYQIPHSEFLRWDAADRDKAIWHHIWKRQTCPDCGTREEEWDPARGGHVWAYIAEPRWCRGCEVKAGARRSVPPEDAEGVHIALIKNEGVASGDA